MTRRSTSPRRPFLSNSARIVCEILEERLNFSPLVWSAGPNLPVARDHGIVLNYGTGNLFISGRTNTYLQASNGLSSWLTELSVPNIGSRMGAALLPGATGGIVVYGGSTPDATTYSPYNADLINDIQPMNQTRSGLGSGSYDGFAYAIGGQNGNTIYNSVEKYNAIADTWTYVAPMPTARYGFATVVDQDGHFYVFGGATANNATSVSNTVYEYDAASNTWSTLTSLPTAVREAGASLAYDSTGNPYIYVVGGATASGVTNLVQRYDVTNNTWNYENNLPVALKGVAVTTESGGRLEVIGGVNAANQSVSTVYLTQQLDQPDIAPVINSTAVIKGSADQPYSYQVTATGNPSPTFSLTSAPAGMTISATGLISWQPLAGQVGTQHVVVHASNIAGSVDQTFDVIVVLETSPPAAPTNVQVTGSTANSISLSWDPAIDNTAVASYNIYYVYRTGWRNTRTAYGLVGNSTTTQFTHTGLASFLSRTYVVKAIDTSGNISSTYSNRASGTTLGAPTLSLYSGTPVATALHPLSFSLYSRAIPAATFSLLSGPAGMSVNPTSGLVTWIPGVTDIGSVPASFRATNSVGHADLNINVTVNPDVPALSYQINPGTGPSYAVANIPMTIKVNDRSFTPSAYSLVTAPSGMLIDGSTGLISWTPAYANAGTNNVVVNATNSAGSTNITIPVLTYFTSKPTGIAASNITSTSATIAWTPPADTSHISSYAIKLWYRTRAGRAYTTKSFNYTAAAGATSVLASGFNPYKTYSISVQAIDSAGKISETGYGSSFVASTPPTPPPAMPMAGLPGGSLSTGSASAPVAFSGSYTTSHLPINVSFDDPDGLWSAYYNDLSRMLQSAGDEWGKIFTTSASLDVQVTFDPTIATTSAASLASQFIETDANGNSVYEAGAATKINTGVDINGASPDVQLNIGVDPTDNFLTGHLWFDPDTNARSVAVPSDKIDAMSVMMHELGHAIGFNGWLDPSTGDSPGTYISTFDQYVAGTDAGGYAFNGGYANAVNDTDPALGTSIYHTTGASSDLMDAAGLAQGTRYDISAIDVAVMQDIGMSMDSSGPNLLDASYIPGSQSSVELAFNESVQSSLNRSDFALLQVSATGAVQLSSDSYTINYDRATNTVRLNLGNDVLPDGQYILTMLASGITDRVGNPMAYDIPLQFQILSGDINADGHVNAGDQAIINANLGMTNATLADGDANHDGTVDGADVAITNSNWHMWLPAIGEVDLPSSTGGDQILLKRESVDMVDVFSDGTLSPTDRIPSYAAAGLKFLGDAGDDTLTLDYSNGIPFSGPAIGFEGGDGEDQLLINGSNGTDTIAISPVSVVVNGSTTHYSAEHVLVDGKNGRDNLTLSAGTTVKSAASQELNLLSIGSNSVFSLPEGSDQQLNAKQLSISSTGLLDLNDNSMLIDYTGTTTSMSQISNWIKSGLVQLGGSGYGIGSSIVDAAPGNGFTLGYVDNAAIDGQLTGVVLNSILIKFTWFGDSNLNGKVDNSDYALIDTGFTSGGTRLGWLFGDFDSNGVVDSTDYALIDTGYISQNRVL